MTDGSFEAQHAGELLSALTDGELEPAAEAAVQRHLVECDACRNEYELIGRSRAALLALPELDPPNDLIEQIVRRRHRILVRGVLGAFGAAVIAAVFLLSADLLPDPAIEPRLGEMAVDHSTTAVTAPDAPTLGSSTSFGQVYVDNEVIGFDLVSVSRQDDVVHAVYRRGQRIVSVFQQRGEVDWDTLPVDGKRLRLGGRDGWQAADASSTVLDADGVVLVFVGDASAQQQLAVEVDDTPSPRWWDRAHDAAQSVLGAFDFG
ncbi:MAG TPA: zf-HC2 domain-containing protein [Acidimicrobiales bacterium]|nr:zf-HC2 domain-containing protein [Acidimicrobiales bacterium]